MDVHSIRTSAAGNSHLFTLRVWYTEPTSDAQELRVQVKHVLTGEVRYFRDWSTIAAYILGKFDDRDAFP